MNYIKISLNFLRQCYAQTAFKTGTKSKQSLSFFEKFTSVPLETLTEKFNMYSISTEQYDHIFHCVKWIFCYYVLQSLLPVSDFCVEKFHPCVGRPIAFSFLLRFFKVQ